MNIGRNDPCPCDSGKKYKHCCLAKAAAEVPVESDVIAAQRKAHDWLGSHFGKRMNQQLVDDYFELVFEESDYGDEDDEDDAILSRFVDGLSDGERYTLDTGLNDWALNETLYERRGAEARGIDWVLEAGDLRLSPAQRTFLQALAHASLRVYEVTGVELDRGLLLRDLLQPDAPARFAHEVAATHGLVAGSLIGVRVITRNGRIELGNAPYPLSLVGALEILWEFHDICDTPAEPLADSARDDADLDHLLATLIRDSWLTDRLRSPYLRTLPLPRQSLVRDRYEVLDLAALEDVLNDCTEVEAFGIGLGWVHLPDDDDVPEHLICHPYDDNHERIVSQIAMGSIDDATADAERLWFESTVGVCVRHREREHTEAGGEDAFHVPVPLPDAADAATTTPEQRTAQTQQRYAEEYADWCGMPLAVLGERTPHAMLVDPIDRVRVELLLCIYDDIERTIARSEQRAPASFDFLRKQLGLPV